MLYKIIFSLYVREVIDRSVLWL